MGIGRPAVLPPAAAGRISAESECLQRALGQHRGDRLPLHGDFDVRRQFDADEVVADLGDAAGHAALGHHFVALGQRFDQRLVFLRALHLRADHQEPQDDEHQQDGQQSHQAAGGVGGACGLSVSGGNEHVELRLRNW
eukprot:c1905_g1_i1.p1 GENE.c1905_g1_i1~~c1905_g1_i1.p1  ORF type:complete len:138 (+),score=4.70 c1905_g1_i1:1-414(+)